MCRRSGKGGQGRIIKKKNEYIVKFPKLKEKLVFNTENEAIDALHSLQDEHYGEYSYRRSQEIAKEIAKELNMYQFDEILVCGDIFEAINNLPEKHCLKIKLKSIIRDRKSGIISEESEAIHLLQLMREYKEMA